MPPFPLPVAVAETIPTSDPPRVLVARGYAAEPKLDGWRGVLAPAAGVLHTRAGTRVESWFPELVDAGRAFGDVVLDGEIVAVTPDGRTDFGALQSRRGGPRRGEAFAVQFAVWDLLGVGDVDWRGRPYLARRAELEARVAAAIGGGPGAGAGAGAGAGGAAGRVAVVPWTQVPEEAQAWWDALVPGHAEGLVFKPAAGVYRGGRGSRWLKRRKTSTREFVVLGVAPTGQRGACLVLAAPRGGRLRAVALSLPIPAEAHRQLGPLLRPADRWADLSGTIAGLPGTDRVRYRPVEPSVVVEVATDGIVEHGRLRHRPRWVRLRGDVEPGAVPPL